MFEIGRMLFGAKRWFFAAFKALLGNRYFWLATGLIVSLWLAWGWHTSTVAQAVKNATQAENSRLTAQFEQDKAATIEAEKARAQKIIDATKEQYEQQRQAIQTRADRLLADARSGTVRLRVHVKSGAVSGGNASGLESNTGAIVADSRAELSDESVRFFVSEAERADQQALQLNELIGIIDQLRRGVSP